MNTYIHTYTRIYTYNFYSPSIIFPGLLFCKRNAPIRERLGSEWAVCHTHRADLFFHVRNKNKRKKKLLYTETCALAWMPTQCPSARPSVAVVGGGPAAVMLCAQLSQDMDVTLFTSGKHLSLGGLCCYSTHDRHIDFQVAAVQSVYDNDLFCGFLQHNNIDVLRIPCDVVATANAEPGQVHRHCVHPGALLGKLRDEYRWFAVCKQITSDFNHEMYAYMEWKEYVNQRKFSAEFVAREINPCLSYLFNCTQCGVLVLPAQLAMRAVLQLRTAGHLVASSVPQNAMCELLTKRCVRVAKNTTVVCVSPRTHENGDLCRCESHCRNRGSRPVVTYMKNDTPVKSLSESSFDYVVCAVAGVPVNDETLSQNVRSLAPTAWDNNICHRLHWGVPGERIRNRRRTVEAHDDKVEKSCKATRAADTPVSCPDHTRPPPSDVPPSKRASRTQTHATSSPREQIRAGSASRITSVEVAVGIAPDTVRIRCDVANVRHVFVLPSERRGARSVSLDIRGQQRALALCMYPTKRAHATRMASQQGVGGIYYSSGSAVFAQPTSNSILRTSQHVWVLLKMHSGG